MKLQDDCAICQKVQACDSGTEPGFIEEFRYSFFLLGDHQYFEGYSMVILKDHVRDMMDLSARLQIEVMQEVMFASRALQLTFQPWKLNHASLGNQATHIHWHIFPRYENDPDLKQHPWLNSDKFAAHKLSDEIARERAAKIRSRLPDCGLF